MKLRAPAVPLITIDPYFSVWSPGNDINTAETMHWCGKRNSIVGTVNVDGQEYSFLGYEVHLLKLRQISLNIDALSTTAVFANSKIKLTAKFTSPVIVSDYNLISRPVSYLEVSYTSADGREHDVSVKIKVNEEICLKEEGQSPVETEKVQAGEAVRGIKMGNSIQKPLNMSGDDICIDWGYFYLMTDGKHIEADKTVNNGKTTIYVKSDISENEKLMYYFAYDDVYSLEYFGKPLKAYWNNDGQTILEAIEEAADDYRKTLKKCEAFSSDLYQRAFEAGGEKYAELLSLAYRQVMAAHKLVISEEGELLYISKECWSNGCAATVDVSYPSIPLFLLYNPELVKGMMRPVYRYALSEDWKYDFAPHDVGQYPLLNGQVYGDNELKYQMPVEECGNMLIMEANTAIATGDASFAAEHAETLKTWCDYLIRYGYDPENQLCTDDFAGHLAHNCNLSLKAVMGLRGMAVIMNMCGKKKEASFYQKEAKKMADNWMKTALNEDGSSKLAFDRPETYSMKYNMVWDKVWKTKLFPKRFMEKELKSNMKHFNEYGMPLDNRADYSKSDWLVWTASMTSSKRTFADFIAPLWQAYNDSTTFVPMTDLYDTVSGNKVYFQHRSVQGGLFMRMLEEEWKTRDIK